MPKVIADITMSLDGFVTGRALPANSRARRPPSVAWCSEQGRKGVRISGVDVDDLHAAGGPGNQADRAAADAERAGHRG